MTDQHPLTDEICEELSSCITILKSGDVDPYISPFDVEVDMQRAADWQLEQVIECLKSQEAFPGSLYYNKTTGELAIDLESIEYSLRQAMRPNTTAQENNWW